MVLYFGKVNAGTVAIQTDPQKIFTTLRRDPRFKRPHDKRSDVLDAWHERRLANDLKIKVKDSILGDVRGMRNPSRSKIHQSLLAVGLKI